MRILCVHGIGHAEARKDVWRQDWVGAITTAVGEWQAAKPHIEQFAYDDLFEAADCSSPLYFEALALLAKSWVVHGGERSILGFVDAWRWHIGMVAQFVALPSLRNAVCDKLAQQIAQFKPDVVVAHSLGGLLAYHCLSSSKTQKKLGDFNGRLITLGTQISHPALRKVFGGYLQCPPMLQRWWNLFNENDRVLTQPIVLPHPARYSQIACDFRYDKTNHDADHYLQHDNARSACWRELVQALGQPAAPAKGKAVGKGKTVGQGVAVADPMAQTFAVAPKRPKMRALLVGIADYADPSFTLLGPVNDVFLVSQTLQEMGVDADAIRVVLNERATAEAIRERLAWLLADAQADDTMFFYFSGHGAQVPAYGQDAEVDRIDECLVPYDFNWHTGQAIFDDEFAALYSVLPYTAKFIAMLDCCHAGGMQRGGVPGTGSPPLGTRSVAMPDDIRHRALRWDSKLQMWLPRKAMLQKGKALKAALLAQPDARTQERPSKAKVEARVGSDGTHRRMCRAQGMRGEDPAEFQALRLEFGHQGPYMPILLEACSENQLAYEYQHGSISYGAFTYGLCESLGRGRGKQLTFAQVIASAQKRVRPVAKGPQTPQLVCADAHRHRPLIG
nr:caspase family protein [uncultured Albidiferax sp.]